jgi:putative tricarboxylic transport membrane protein
VIALAVVLAIGTSQIEYAFSSDPVGPKGFPYILAAALAICGVWYFLQPGFAETWPDGATLRATLALIAVTAIAISLMDQIGFLIAAFVVCAFAAFSFGAPPLAAVFSGAVQAAFWFVLFKYALGTYLPSGTWLPFS